MSDKSESFNEWWEMFELHCISSDEKIKVIEIVESAWNHQQKKIDELEEQLRGERQATKTFSEHLNNERVRHGSTEKKLQAAEEKLTECASNYWKEVEKRKAAEEDNKRLQNKIVEKSREVTKMELILENNHLCRRKDKKHIDNIEEENKTLREAIEYAIYQREQEYGMDSVYDIYQFRQRKVFSILGEALEKTKPIDSKQILP